MRALLLLVTLGCGSERAPEPAVPATEPAPAVQAQTVTAEYAPLHKELRTLIDAASALAAGVKVTKSDTERDVARQSYVTLVTQVAPLKTKLEAFTRRLRALPPTQETTALSTEVEIDEVLFKGVATDLDDAERSLRRDQAEVDRETTQQQQIDDAKAKLEQLRKSKK